MFNNLKKLLIIFLLGPAQTDDTCGVVYERAKYTRGGVESKYGPWTVSVGYDDSEVKKQGKYLSKIFALNIFQGNYHHECTGVILSETVILTAAHCTEPFNDRKYKVHAGGLNPRLRGVEERNIERFIIHPDYDNSAFYFDLGLLYLDKVQFEN